MAEGAATYSESEWAAIGPGRPMKDLTAEQLLLLHRHYVWTILQKTAFADELTLDPSRARSSDGQLPLADKPLAAMYLWYALLWATIEGLRQRHIPIGGELDADIKLVSPTLKRCRDAVFHIPRERYYDDRLFGLMSDQDSALRVRRITSGLGRLFIEEMDARR